MTLVSPDVHRAQKNQNPHFSIDERLGEITAPVLLVRGDADGVVPPDRQHDMARKLRRPKEVVLSGEGHMLPPRKSGARRARDTHLPRDRDSKHPRLKTRLSSIPPLTAS